VRDDFAAATKLRLAQRVGFRCSNPDCQQPTSGPQADPVGSINIGVAAHITAAAPGGARYDPNLDAEQRRSIEIGIWLCQNCAKLVDNDEVSFPVELLHAWKTVAEQRAKQAIVAPGTQQLRQIPDSGANIQLRIDAQQFSRCYGSRSWRQEDPLKSEHGFDPEGVPNWTSLWARLRVANLGFESGDLYLELDSDQSNMPIMFNLPAARVEFLQPLKVPARKVLYPDIFIDIPFTDRTPSGFAKQVGTLLHHGGHYQVVLHYWTESVDGATEPQEFIIEIDFQNFFDEVIEHWKGFGFTSLADIAHKATA
jgi:hypothetical protein